MTPRKQAPGGVDPEMVEDIAGDLDEVLTALQGAVTDLTVLVAQMRRQAAKAREA